MMMTNFTHIQSNVLLEGRKYVLKGKFESSCILDWPLLLEYSLNSILVHLRFINLDILGSLCSAGKIEKGGGGLQVGSTF